MSRKIEFINIKEEDLELIRGWRNSEGVSKYMYTDQNISKEQQKKWFENQVKGSETNRYWIITYNNEKVGLVSINNIDKQNNKCSWAFYIGIPDLKGGGVGSIVEYKVIEFVFSELKMNKLCCEVFAFNKGVIKLHGKFGFVEEGLLKQHIYKAGKYLDVYTFALFPEQWAEKKSYIEKILKIK